MAGADRLVERIVARHRAERRDIALAEAALGLRAIGEFAHRHQDEFLDDLSRALGLGIECLDALDGVAEEVEPYGLVRPGGNRSTRLPRTANSPGSITVPVRM